MTICETRTLAAATPAKSMPGAEAKLPFVSVIVPVWDNPIQLQRCLDALARQSYTGRFEIIVVDNGSAQSLDELQAVYPTVVFLCEHKPGSYNARNTGIAHARGEIFAFTDSDCVPDRDWLRFGVMALLHNPETALVGGRIIVTLAKPPSASTAELYDFVVGFPQERCVKRSGCAATANLLTWRKVVETVGRFNGELFSGGDLEWSFRAVRSHKPSVYGKRAVVYHPARTSVAELFKKMSRRAAGQRDVAPDNVDCARFVMRMCVAVLVDICALFGNRARSLTARQKLAVFAFIWRVRLFTATERLRYQLSHAPSPRA